MPLSTSIETSCCTNSGLPVGRRDDPVPDVAGPPRRPGARRPAAPESPAGERRAARRRTLPSRSPQSGRFSSSVSRPVATTSTADWRAVVVEQVLEEVEERRLRVVDVLDDDDDRPGGREGLEELAHAPEDLGDRVPAPPTARSTDDSRSRMSPAPGTPASSVAELVTRLVGRVVVARCRRRARAISTSGQNVMPSPYGRQRPRSTRGPAAHLAQERVDEVASCRRPPRRARVTTRQPPRPTVSRRPPCSSASSARGRRAARLAGQLRGRRRRVADVDQPVGGHALGLALELQRLDRLDLDLRPDEAVGDLADEDLVRRAPPARAGRRR